MYKAFGTPQKIPSLQMLSTEANRNVESTMAAWPIKFVKGSQPAKKRKTDSKLPKKNDEEARGDREFQLQWQDGRFWLQYDKERGMTCSWCLDK